MDTVACGRSGEGVPIRTRGQASGTLGKYVLCEIASLRNLHTCPISNISLDSMLIVHCKLLYNVHAAYVCANGKLVNVRINVKEDLKIFAPFLLISYFELLPYFAERAVERGDSCSTASQSPCASWI